MTYDPLHRQIVISGGTTGLPPSLREFLADAWALDDSTWIPLPSAPVAWIDPVLAYDEASSSVMMLGEAEISGGGFAGVVELDATAWHSKRVSPLLPDPQIVTYDPFERAIVGVEINAPEDRHAVAFLRYRAADEMPESCSGADDLDSDGMRGCRDPECWAYCDPSCPPATSCPADRARCGDGTCEPSLETSARCPEDCP